MSQVHRISFGAQDVEKPFSIEHIMPELLSADHLRGRADAVRAIMLAAWKAKLVPAKLSIADLGAHLPLFDAQTERIVHPKNDARYWMAFGDFAALGDPEPATAHTLLRVETYKPRSPFKKPYPNVTDLESQNGEVTRQYENAAAALVYFALSEYDADRKAAAYELAGSDGIGFYENVGFARTGNEPEEQIAGATIRYVHLEAPSVGMATGKLEEQYPWLTAYTEHGS